MLALSLLALSLLALSLLTMPGCIDHLLEAPYVLATGVGQGATSISPTPQRSLLVGSPAGAFEVDGSGRVHAFAPGPVIAAVAHAGWVALVRPGDVAFGTLADGVWTATGTVALVGGQQAQAWCDTTLMVLTKDALVRVSPSAPAKTWATAPPGALDISLGFPDSCANALVTTPTQLLLVSPTGTVPVATGLVDARSATYDERGTIWVVHGQPLVLARIVDGKPVELARHLADVSDLHFGNGQLLHGDNAYMLTTEGTVDYVRVPATP